VLLPGSNRVSQRTNESDLDLYHCCCQIYKSMGGSLDKRGSIRRDLGNEPSLIMSYVMGWGLGGDAIIKPDATCQGVIGV